jgi:hypothetical protein
LNGKIHAKGKSEERYNQASTLKRNNIFRVKTNLEEIILNTFYVTKVYQLIVTICEASTHHLGFNIGNEKSLKIILEKTNF